MKEAEPPVSETPNRPSKLCSKNVFFYPSPASFRFPFSSSAMGCNCVLPFSCSEMSHYPSPVLVTENSLALHFLACHGLTVLIPHTVVPLCKPSGGIRHLLRLWTSHNMLQCTQPTRLHLIPGACPGHRWELLTRGSGYVSPERPFSVRSIHIPVLVFA